MLGKQAWRILMHPSSLVSRVFKARYFSDGDFLSAPLGSNPSFIWRSVREAQTLLKSGLRRRIGNGRSTSIMSDPWIPHESQPFITSPVLGLDGCTVSALFSENDRRWDEDVVYDLFSTYEANLILGIPLCDAEVEDTWFWSKDISGSYTVKSAYRLCSEAMHVVHGSDNSGFWRKLWQLKVPPKVKEFIWRAALNILPTKINLRARSVEVDPRCEFCGIFGETSFHCLVQCEFATEVWEVARVVVVGDGVGSVRGWLNEVIKSSTIRELARVVMICWALWRARNDVVWNQRRRPAAEVVGFADLELSQWLKALGKEGYPSMQPPVEGDGCELWSTPVGNGIKVNVDAALFSDEATYGLSFVARDAQGQLIAARARTRPGVVTPELAEAMSLKEVLSWIQLRPAVPMIVEMDCQVVVLAVRSSIGMISAFGMVVEECKSILKSLSNVRLLFVKRSANRAAHCLARQSRCYADRLFFEGYVPPVLLDVLNLDLN